MIRRKQFYFATSGIVLLAVILRLGTPLEYDEIWTIENYASGTFRKIFTDLALPNNHLLNSLLVKLISGEWRRNGSDWRRFWPEFWPCRSRK